MSKAEIMEQLPKLNPADRSEILDRLFELHESDLVAGGDINPEDKALLDAELQDYARTLNDGEPWEMVHKRIINGTGQ